MLFIITGFDESRNLANFFMIVAHHSPMLKQLRLSNVDMGNVPIDALPSSIESLAITESFLPSDLFQRALTLSSTAFLPHLRELDLSDTHTLYYSIRRPTEEDLDTVTVVTVVADIVRAWPELRVLKLNRWKYTHSPDLASVAGLRQLEVLEVAERGLYDENGMIDVCNNLRATLRHLNVSGCSDFTDYCAGAVAPVMTNLQYLDASNCFFLTDDGLLQLAQLTQLRYLNITMTELLRPWSLQSGISNDAIEELKTSLPECNIVHEV